MKRTLACLSILLAASSLQAATQYWDTSTTAGLQPTTGTWNLNTTANWSATTAGSNPLLNWTANSDTAAFVLPTGAASATVTVSNTNGQVGAYGLRFSGTIGSTATRTFGITGDTLRIGAGGVTNTLDNASTSYNINLSAPIELSASQTWSNSRNAADRFIVSGAISSSSGLTTNFTYDGRGAGTSSTLTLSGANTYDGSTTVTGGGILKLDYTAQNNSKLADSKALILGGGSLTLVPFGTTANVYTETVGSTLLATGANTINRLGSSTTNGNILVNLNAISRNSGATLDIVPGTASGGYTPGYGTTGLTTDTLNTNGIIGGYATVSGTSWATSAASGTDVGITSTNGTNRATSSVWAGGTDNVNSTASESGITSKTINSLRLGTASMSLGFGSGAVLTVNSGGIIAANSGQSITGGSITSGSGELFVHTPNALTVSSSIIDNGGTPTALVKAGSSSLTLTGASTYTGGTYVNSGTLIVGAGGSITGSVAVRANASFDVTNAGFTVSSGNSLTGGGSVSGNVVIANGGALSAVTSFSDDAAVTQRVTGTLTLANNLSLNDGAAITMGLGTNSSLISLTNASGVLTGSTAAGSIALSLFDAGGATVGQTYTLMSWQSGTTLTSFDLADFTVSGLTGTLQFGSNSLEIVVATVPEPSTWSLMALGAVAFFFVVRRRAARIAAV